MPNYIAINELSYLKTIADALVTSGWFDRSYIGLSNEMAGRRVIVVQPVETDDDSSAAPALWEGSYEVIVGVSQPMGGSDAYIGTSSEPGLMWLAEKTVETINLNLTANGYNFDVGRVRYERFSLHPNFVARFTVDIKKGINPRDRDRTGTNGVVVPALQAQNIDDLGDVTISAQASGEALVWNGSAWVNSTVSTVTSLSGLSDTTITAPASGNTLRYNGSKWIDEDGVTIKDEATGIPLKLPTLSAMPGSYSAGDTWIGFSGGTLYLWHCREDTGTLARVNFVAA